MTEPLFYRDGSPVPAEIRDRFDRRNNAYMGKSGTVGEYFARAPCNRCGGAGGSPHWPGFTCFRCGGRHSRFFESVAVKVYTAKGLDRARKAAERAEKRRAEKAEAKERERREAFASWVAEDPRRADVVASLRSYRGRNDFLRDLAGRVADEDTLTDRQVEAAESAIEREARFAEEEAKAEPLPDTDGRIEIEGEVLKVENRDSYYGTTLKMLVRSEGGWKVWGTVPRSLRPSRGDRVRFVAAIEPSREDPSFGFFSRPTKAEEVEVGAA